MSVTASLKAARECQQPLQAAIDLSGLAFLAYDEQAYAETCELATEGIAVCHSIGEHMYLSALYAARSLAERGLGNTSQAHADALEALRVILSARVWFVLLPALIAVALLLADAGAAERSAELHALVERQHPDPHWHGLRQELAAVVVVIPPALAAASTGRGYELGLWATTAALLAELEAAGWGAPA